MTNFKKYDVLLGWAVFIIATLVYFLTLEPTASWWDCGEYIATAYKLQVGHPPGAPLFQLLGRFFSLFAFGNLEHVALMINIMSALSSSFTILFLFWTITMLGKKLVAKDEDGRIPMGSAWAIFGAALVGSLAYTFSDSFWFSAVEGEVYAMSSFFTAVVFWAILRWEEVADQRHAYRWLLLIAYIMGLSIGVHLLNLLAIPAIVYVYYYKKYTYSHKGFVIAGMTSLLILSIVMYIIIPWIVELAGKFELLFVNGLGLPFNSGTVIYFALILGLVGWGLYFTRKKSRVVWNTVLLAVVFILIGYSSFFMLVIRANANTPINENDPKDAISLLSYLNREQYGTWPLLYGQYYNAPVVDHEDGNPVYIKDFKKGKYVINDDRKSTIPVYDKRFCSVFPRMWSNQKPSHISLYKQYGGDKGTPVQVTRDDGTKEIIYKPTFGENLKFFFTYQVNHMYLRYFMWNFVGRQNNIESQGEIYNGNWISGIGFLDKIRLGDQSNLPASMKNPARTSFYFLPLLLGLFGFMYQLGKSKKESWVVFLLFIMTGLAIIVYLNQTPMQPRERDYAYAGSFYAFAIWIGLGVMGLYELLQTKMSNKVLSAGLVSAACLLLVPGIMAKEGWKSHDRSGKYAARDVARMYLESCEPNAILFTNGDNDTFPLWYVQEVEGIRTDVRVVNYMLSSGDWYVDQMFRKVYDSDVLPLTIDRSFYARGDQNYIPVFERIEGVVDVQDALEFVENDDKRTKVPLQSGDWISYMPSKNLRLKVDARQVVASGTVSAADADKIVPEINWRIGQSGLFRNDLMLLDLIAANNWERPVYFANPNAISKVLNVDKYCHLEGIVYRFKPTVAPEFISKIGGVDVDRTYKILMADDTRWGRLNEPDVTVDRESDRNSGLIKQNYIRLAQGLSTLNKKDSLEAVLDRGIYFFPNDKFPFDYYMIPWAEYYYRAGAIEKGNNVARTIADRYLEDLAYYGSVDDRFVPAYDESIQEGMAVIQRLIQVTGQFKQTELSKEIETAFFDQMGTMNLR